MKASDLPARIVVPFASGASATYVRQGLIPTASQIGITDGAWSFMDGSPPLNFQDPASGGVPPDGRDFNALGYMLSAWTRWQSAGGTTVFDAGFAAAVAGYPAGAIVASRTPGTLWQSTVDGNTTDPDGSSASGWIAFVSGASQNTYVANYVVNNYAKGSLIARRVFTSSQTYNPTTDASGNSIVRAIRAIVTGGGGAGGGTVATGNGQFAAAAGGGAGDTEIGDFTSGFAGAYLTIGAGAIGLSGASGGLGGISSLGSIASASGGQSGSYGVAGSVPATFAGGSGGTTGAGGNVSHNAGAAGANSVGFSQGNVTSGAGGGSYWGAGGSNVFTSITPGQSATSFGAGGGGAVAQANAPAQTGGNGAPGVIVIEEYR